MITVERRRKLRVKSRVPGIPVITVVKPAIALITVVLLNAKCVVKRASVSLTNVVRLSRLKLMQLLVSLTDTKRMMKWMMIATQSWQTRSNLKILNLIQEIHQVQVVNTEK